MLVLDWAGNALWYWLLVSFLLNLPESWRPLFGEAVELWANRPGLFIGLASFVLLMGAARTSNYAELRRAWRDRERESSKRQDGGIG